MSLEKIQDFTDKVLDLIKESDLPMVDIKTSLLTLVDSIEILEYQND